MVDQFELPSDVTIYTVAGLRDAMMMWVNASTETASPALKLSARQVESIDGAGLQLIASLGSMGIRWQLRETSPAFSEACAMMGLSEWLTPPDDDDLSLGGSA